MWLAEKRERQKRKEKGEKGEGRRNREKREERREKREEREERGKSEEAKAGPRTGSGLGLGWARVGPEQGLQFPPLS